LQEVAVRARPMPPEMLKPGYVTEAFIDYARPLVGPLESFLDLSDRYLRR